VPLSATDGLSKMDGKGLDYLEEEGEEVKVTVDLDALHEVVKALKIEEEDEEVNERKYPRDEEEEEVELNEEDIFAMLSEDEEEVEEESEEGSKMKAAADEDSKSGYGGTNEEIEVSQDLIDSIMEKLTVDMGADLSGWAGRPDFQVEHEMEKELAHRRSTDVEEKMKILKKAQEELVFENKQLKKSNRKYKQVVEEIKGTLQDVNVSNARLLYTNRVLRNTSLNERQKDNIAEAISNAGSVMEAKTIFETLELAAPAQTKRAPQSLSEAISRPSSIIRASRREAQPTDPFLDRMKKLAGIKN